MGNMLMIMGILIFLVTFYFIITEKYPKSLVSVIGGALMVVVNILNEKKALEVVGHNLEILVLLIGMMIIVEIMSETGIFQWVAIKIAQSVNGDPIKILALLSIVTATFSAFLDNVTTILLIVPVTIFLAKRLELDPKPFVLMQIFMSNIGGTATMIGDPPNLIIGSLGKITFNEFIVHLGPIVLINAIVLIVSASLYLKPRMHVSRELRATIMELDLSRTIKNKKLLMQSIIVFMGVILGFLTNSFTDIGLSIIAVLGAGILVVLSGKKPEDVLVKVEWDTLFFFGGLFVVIQGIEELGIVKMIGEYVVSLTAGNLELTSSLILLVSAGLSPIIGSIPHALSFGKIILEILPN
ncbi:SLC13 family permease, partial [Fusobacterium sp.]